MIDKEIIQKTRNAFKLTQKEAAKMVHCKSLTWSQWETGRNNMHPAFWELFLIKAKRKLKMETKFYVYYDGNHRGTFNSREQAEMFILNEEGRGEDSKIIYQYCDSFFQLWSIHEITFSQNNEIVLFNDQDFDQFIESISDEIGSKEFENTKERAIKEYMEYYK